MCIRFLTPLPLAALQVAEAVRVLKDLKTAAEKLQLGAAL